jgi:hypothetical protein
VRLHGVVARTHRRPLPCLDLGRLDGGEEDRRSRVEPVDEDDQIPLSLRADLDQEAQAGKG